MAFADKNILITPNIGSSTDDPKIEFTGADASGSDVATLGVSYDGTSSITLDRDLNLAGNAISSGAITSTGSSSFGDVAVGGVADSNYDLKVYGLSRFEGVADFTGNITFGDSNKAIFGTDSDLQIYHDGTNSYIDEVGTGNLLVRANSLQLSRANGSQLYLAANTGAEVALYHAGNSRLATTSTGIDVTGTATMNDAVISDSNPTLTIYETDTTNLNTRFDNGGGDLYIQTVNDDGSSAKTRILIDHATGDISFYDTAGTTAKLSWSAADESLGIGTSSPTNPLTVVGTGASTLTASKGAVVDYQSSSVSNIVPIGFSWSSSTSTQNPYWGMAFIPTNYSSGIGELGFYTGNTERMRLDSSGNVGIGITDPTTKLHVAGIVQVVESSNTAFYGGDYVRVFGSGQQYGFRDIGGVTKANISMGGNSYFNGGNVGIGTSSPSSLLELEATGSTVFNGTSTDGQAADGTTLAIQNLSDTDNTFSQILFRNRNTSKAVSRIASLTDSTGTEMAFVVENNGSPAEVLRIGKTGNVGIGTSSPARQLHISKGSNDTPTTVRIENVDTTIETNQEVNTIEFYSNDASASGTGVSAKIAQVADNPGNQYGLAFSTYNTTLAEAMRIDSGGNVIIGSDTVNASDAVTLRPDGTAHVNNAQFSNSNGTVGATTPSIYSPASATLAVSTNSTERIRIGTDLSLLNGTKLSVDTINCASNQQLVLNSGESKNFAVGQTGELLYVNAEAGLQINSSPDNWVGGWASRYTATICDSTGNSSLPGGLKLRGTFEDSVGDNLTQHNKKFDWVKTNTGSSGANVWYKVADISIADQTFSAIAMEIVWSTGVNNYGYHDFIEKYHAFATFVRNDTATLNNSPDTAILRGQGVNVRAYKTGIGTYELQARGPLPNQKYAVAVRIYQSNGGTISPALNGSTLGATTGGTEFTISPPGASDSDDGVVEYFGNIRPSNVETTSIVYNNGTGDQTKLSTSNLSSFIEVGSKPLQVIGSNSVIFKNASNNPWLQASDLGVELFTGATKRLETTSTGAEINGVLTILAQDPANGEGGELRLGRATTSSLTGDVIIDSQTNSLRIFEGSANFRGAYLDISTCANNVASKIWHSENDGPSSGLNADLLDGEQGSYYQNASNLNAGTVNDARLPATISSNITGNAATATSATTANGLNSANSYNVNAITTNAIFHNDLDRNANSANYYPNSAGKSARFRFVQANTVGTGGNYAGMLQFNPWTGTTTSTGDASYQLIFGSTAANGSGVPELRIRNGIDTTWNDWNIVQTSSASTTAINKSLSPGEICTVTASGRTITLPGNPSAGQQVSISVGNFTDTIVARNGQNIMGLAEDMTIDVANSGLTFAYSGNSTQGWRLI